MWFGGALQMMAAFLLLAFVHYFAAAFLPIADCDETYNFIEPIHQLLYGTGLQTWENCPIYALRSWLFAWIYAAPAFLVKSMPSLRSVDVYFFIRIFHGRVACLGELFFVYSVWVRFSGRTALIALLLLLLNYPIPHAAVSALPTSFVMINNFIALGCWLRTERSHSNEKCEDHFSSSSFRKHLPVFGTVFFVVFSCILGWPFAGLAAFPMAIDLLIRHPIVSVFSLIISLLLIIPPAAAVDMFYYCRPTWSAWNLVRYNLLSGDERGPELYGIEPWYYFIKNLLLNAHFMFLAGVIAPLVILGQSTIQSQTLGIRTRTTRNTINTNKTTTKEEEEEEEEKEKEEERGRGRGGNSMGKNNQDTSISLRKRTPFVSSPINIRVPSVVPISPFSSSAQSTQEQQQQQQQQQLQSRPVSKSRMLLYISPFFLWFTFWLTVPHKEERFMAPVFPFLVLAAALSITQLFFSSGSTPIVETTTTTTGNTDMSTSSTKKTSDRNNWAKTKSSHSRYISSSRFSRLLPAVGWILLLLFGIVSFSRGMAVYHFYAGPQRILYDSYSLLQDAAAQHVQSHTINQNNNNNNNNNNNTTIESQLYTLCIGREWYRFPSSFFLDQRYARVAFIKTTTFSGALPLPYARDDNTATCRCGSPEVNDRNREIAAQYVGDVSAECDAILDSHSPFNPQESRDYPSDVFIHKFSTLPSSQLLLLDVDRTPMWCRVLYYPFGITERCAVWREVDLVTKHPLPTTTTTTTAAAEGISK
ncbi:putative dolichyl-P-Man:GDP-Man5GlcNAc2-PP-dolichyl alpha-1,2-mannosyltransferase [Trypanosoma theileri]|uniref:Mannosyltransferase n=1 Tax=Trypanosoma theileri TaxID=67003 RepID=A0A1X0NM38_9TRYP|nr:putative dolichyl-P-Man:GDP-Man5GlcNAc2-PP-dolichyl alpha-1,2-mannosyltransferase [Trypanosoma theileri]ORC85804.1 putative dolichyl-P-Man:GDP-Man5GlcNAc2-PP-dolichyl alpha-1,2-mannosyltransferase [Trypanosoma theileri]